MVDALAVGATVEDGPVVDEVVVDGALVRDDVEIVEESGDVISQSIRSFAFSAGQIPEPVIDTANSRKTVKVSQYSAQKILLAGGDAYGTHWNMVMVRHTLLGVTRKKKPVFFSLLG